MLIARPPHNKAAGDAKLAGGRGERKEAPGLGRRPGTFQELQLKHRPNRCRLPEEKRKAPDCLGIQGQETRKNPDNTNLDLPMANLPSDFGPSGPGVAYLCLSQTNHVLGGVAMETAIRSLLPASAAKIKNLLDTIERELPKCKDANFRCFVQRSVIANLKTWLEQKSVDCMN
jgi:hypothetical protein